MEKHHNIIIAGAGGIAEAAGLLLIENSKVIPTIYVGDRGHDKAKKVAKWLEDGTNKKCKVEAFHLPEEGEPDALKKVFEKADLILDCLPGSVAPRIAKFAKEHSLHYVNLTEYVEETNKIKALAKNAKTGFILQTGIAPGYINILAHALLEQFCKDFEVEKVDTLEFKVGALTKHAVSPHFYGFTWSPIGVATEYVKDAIAIRKGKKVNLKSLSERDTIIIDGISYESDLTSGGAADLPDALLKKVRSLDYKTLRFPGHYNWIDDQLGDIKDKVKAIEKLQEKMLNVIPLISDDQIILYAAVEGKDNNGVLQRREVANKILPLKVGKHTLRAIQTTTAAPMLQCAQLLLEGDYKGVILQSDINSNEFLNGDFITKIYGHIDLEKN